MAKQHGHRGARRDDGVTAPRLDVTYHDDPRVLRHAATEDYAAHVVPMSWRSSRGSMAMAWYALLSAMAWLVTAGVAAVEVGTRDALIGALLSVFAYSGICSAMATYSARTGTNVNLFSRMVFGFGGGVIATLVLFAIATFYATFEGAVVSHAFHAQFGTLPIELWYLVVVGYSVPLAFGGVRAWLDRFNGALLPFYAAGMVVAVVWTISVHGYDGSWFTQRPEQIAVAGPGWVYAFSLYMGVWVLMMFAGDMARYARVGDLRFHRWVTFGPVFHFFTLFVNAVLGIFLANALVSGPLDELSAVDGMLALMGIGAVALIWVTQTRINTANYYIASSNLENLAARVSSRRIPRVAWVVTLGVVVYVVMLQDIIAKLAIALEYSGIITVAWIGVVLAYMLWSRLTGQPPERLEFRPGRVPVVNWPGVIAWTGGAALGVVLLNLAGRWGETWYAPATLVFSFLFYLGALALARDYDFVLARRFDPRRLVDDPWEARIRCHVCDMSYVAQEMDCDPSAGQQAICAACAASDEAYLRAAHAEARAARGGAPATPRRLGVAG